MATQIYSLVVNYNVGGQFASNVLHYQFDDSGYNSTYQAAAALITKWVATCLPAYKLCLPTSTAILSVKSKRVSAIGGFEAIEVLAAGQTGARTGAVMVAGTGPCIVLIQSANGPHRGRVFLPGVSISDCIDGVFSDAFVAAVVAAMPTMFSPIVLAGGGAPTAQVVIYHRQSHSGVAIGGSILSIKVATQRRRQVPV